MRTVTARAWVGMSLGVLAMIVLAACDDGADDARSTATGSARETSADAMAEQTRGMGARPRVRLDGEGARGADASALDGGLDASHDGGPDAALDGQVSDAMPSPMPIEDAALDAGPGTGGLGGFGGEGGRGGTDAFGEH